ncbi:hypothetical protein FF38_05400 [Lucilia cuprina]|uniref:SAP domain-containing protein n=1 Tax=Lucilia cuprina TaxID=7375 RepID=A0A0L0C3N7_LUCCU|nr:hypothetical protein FF38_05400 [Lucilia cuprina]
MKFEELKVVKLKRELSKLELPTAGNKAELQKRLIDEFKRRDIDIGTYEFEYKDETDEQHGLKQNFKAEVQESSKANFTEFKTEIQEMSEVINNRVDRIDRKVADLETNIDKKKWPP